MGSIPCLTLNGDGWAEQLNPHGHGFIVKSSSVFLCDGGRLDTNSKVFEEIWLMVACLSVWRIRIKRCKFVFQQQKLSCGEVLLNILFELMAWLRRWYDSI